MEGSIELMIIQHNQVALRAMKGQKKPKGLSASDDVDKLASIQLRNILNVKCDNEKKISKNPKVRQLQSTAKDALVSKYDCSTIEAEAIIASTTATTRTTPTTTLAKRNPFSEPIKVPSSTNPSHSSSSCSLPKYFTNCNSSNGKPNNVIKTKQFTNKNGRKQAIGFTSNSTSASSSIATHTATTPSTSTILTTATVTATTTPATPKSAASTTAVSTLATSTATASTSPPSTPSTAAHPQATATLTVSSTAATVATTNFTLTPIVHRNNKGGHFKIPSDMLDDLASRFIINSPEVEQTNLIRLCFQLEMAHWFYLDFFTAVDEAERKERKLFPCGIKSFATQMFQHIPFLTQHAPNVETILDDWKNYKLSVPTYGAILLSDDLNFCLLVQSYFSKSSWGFPKGKVNEHERPEHCAAREVFEETGYNISDVISTNDFIEANINYQYTRLYVVPNVSLKTQFSPRTRNEIKSCDWFPIDSLPTNRNDAITKAKLGLNANSFFMIIPFVKRLKRRVQELRDGVNLPNPATMGLSALSSSPTDAQANNFFFNNQKNSGKKNKNGVNPTPATGSASRVKRQRHKSMGDLENTQLAGPVNSNNNSFKCQTVGNALEKKPEVKQEQLAIPNGQIANGSNTSNGSNYKRNAGKFNAAGSNCTNSQNNGSTTKRQLFHSQSHNGAPINEKNIVTNHSLDQKQPSKLQNSKPNATMVANGGGSHIKYNQMNFTNGNGNDTRARALSQSGKVSPQQQLNSSVTIMPYAGNVGKFNANGSGSGSGGIKTTKQRAQKSFSYCNGSDSAVGMVAALDNGLGHIHKEDDVNSSNRTTTPTKNLLQMLALSNSTARPSGGEAEAKHADKKDISLYAELNGLVRQPQGMQKGHPASVGVSQTKNLLHLMCMPSVNNLRYPTYDKLANPEEPTAAVKKSALKETPKIPKIEPVEQQKLPMLQFGQVRLLQRGNSLDALQLLNEQTKSADDKDKPNEPGASGQDGQQNNQIEQQAQIFTPSTDSWMNFSFTKNFISNVFC